MKSLYLRAKMRAMESELKWADVFAAFCCAFMLSSLVFVWGGDFTSLSYTEQYPLVLSIAICFAGFIAIIGAVLALREKKIISLCILPLAVLLALSLVTSIQEDIFFNVGIGAVLILVCKYASDNDWAGFARLELTKRRSLVIVWIMIALFVAVVFFFTALRYKSFYHSTFDFGIFAQMFENMCERGIPVTSVERTGELSHFAVHFSPFYYVLLPGYFIFRSPLYLLFVQALGVALGALAVRRICHSLYFSEKCTVALCAIYLLFPTMANGCFYDFHENKFLAVLILWAVAFALEKKAVGFCVFSFLVLTVKEDAFIYVLAICLWMLITNRMRIVAAITAAFAVFWFFFACTMMVWLGGEIMDSRFAHFALKEGAGLLDAARNCFVNIGYLIKEVFAGADTAAFREMTYSGQKLEFLLWTCFPLCFTPFLRKKTSSLVLLIPMLVINLMPRWMYQYDVDFQYTYGSCALLFVLFILYLRDARGRKRAFVITSALLLSTLFLASLAVPKAKTYYERYFDNMASYDATEEALGIIEDDASVTVYGYMMPHISHIKELYPCPNHNSGEPFGKTDYYVIDTRYEFDDHTQRMYIAMEDDYELLVEKGYAKIYKLKD